MKPKKDRVSFRLTAVDSDSLSVYDFAFILLGLSAPDGTRFGDEIPRSRYRRCFCGHCAAPIRAKLSRSQLRFRDNLRKFLKAYLAKIKPGEFARLPVLPVSLAASAFRIRSIMCEKCEPAAAPWRRSARRPKHIRERLESLVEEDSD